MSLYQATIAADLHVDAATARRVEAWMRSEHPTLDHLSPEAFLVEERLALMLTRAAGPEESDALANSLGL